jgi:hypothetical protein
VHISLKDGDRINIGGVLALVIRTMVGPNLLDTIAGERQEVPFSYRAHDVFTISKISVCTKPTVISSISTGVFFPVNQAVTGTIMQVEVEDAETLYVNISRKNSSLL